MFPSPITEDDAMEPTLDSRVLTRALVYAVGVIDELPEASRRREAFARDAMVHCFHLMVPHAEDREEMARQVEAITGRAVDLTDWQLE